MKKLSKKKPKWVRKMPTNEERREVARRLRELAGTYITIGDLESALCIDMSSGRVDIARDSESISGLADLIEPEPERTCKIVNSENKFANWECSACGEEIKYSDNYCPNCGAKVVK